MLFSSRQASNFKAAGVQAGVGPHLTCHSQSKLQSTQASNTGIQQPNFHRVLRHLNTAVEQTTFEWDNNMCTCYLCTKHHTKIGHTVCADQWWLHTTWSAPVTKVSVGVIVGHGRTCIRKPELPCLCSLFPYVCTHLWWKASEGDQVTV